MESNITIEMQKFDVMQVSAFVHKSGINRCWMHDPAQSKLLGKTSIPSIIACDVYLMREFVREALTGAGITEHLDIWQTAEGGVLVKTRFGMPVYEFVLTGIENFVNN